MNYLFDTNIVIYFLGKMVLSNSALNHIDKICAHGVNLSIISRLELLGYHFEDAANEEATKKFVNSAHIYQINPGIEDVTIQIRKATKIKLPDAIIAATAINGNLTLITANDKDFRHLTKLKILNPFDL